MRRDVMPKLDLDPGGLNTLFLDSQRHCFSFANFTSKILDAISLGYMKDCDSKSHHARHLCEYPLQEARWLNHVCTLIKQLTSPSE